ncbi:hypothetical protein DEJ49_13595 [Streptomyces venezuelae]|uniref:Uncharacterized protein n=1 Tax=Streptomyces venezuelae TaxID=54571 RepID=A0A5P2CJP3_STRVZ|nr:hypothetical protein DEJ49_13595 [Streptomyces venezuelae]
MPPAIIVAAPISRNVVSVAPVSASSPLSAAGWAWLPPCSTGLEPVSVRLSLPLPCSTGLEPPSGLLSLPPPPPLPPPVPLS